MKEVPDKAREVPERYREILSRVDWDNLDPENSETPEKMNDFHKKTILDAWKEAYPTKVVRINLRVTREIDNELCNLRNRKSKALKNMSVFQDNKMHKAKLRFEMNNFKKKLKQRRKEEVKRIEDFASENPSEIFQKIRKLDNGQQGRSKYTTTEGIDLDLRKKINRKPPTLYILPRMVTQV